MGRKLCKTNKFIIRGHTIVVEKSTLPVRTAETIKNILFSSNQNKNQTFSVLSNPEFLSKEMQ